MFKADPKPKPSANIKSSERRALYGDICKQFKLPKERILKDVERVILPATVKQSSFRSAREDQGFIYYDNSETPVWFESNEKNSPLYPSVFTLWNCPAILPMVVTHPHVIKVLCNGAGLMLPGCVLPFDRRIKKGDVVAVSDSDAPHVAKAVGVACIDLGEVNKVVGETGLAVKITHWLGDGLCKLNQYVDIKVPKELELVVPWEEVKEEDPAEEQKEVVDDSEPTDDTTSQETRATEDTTIDEKLAELSVEDLDHLFTRALLQAIKVENIDVPVNASTFMSSYVLKNLPVLDAKYKTIKKTGWKKTGKYLKAMSKLGYIQIKGKDDDLTITGTIPKTDSIIVNFITHKVDKPKSTDTKKEEDNNSIRILQLYQPVNKHRMFFNKISKFYNQLYDSKQLTTMLNYYVKQHSLSDPKDPKFILADEVLSDVLSKPRISRKDITQDFMKLMTKKYVVLQPGETIEDAEIFNGEIPKVEIVCETRIGRKTVTRVRNFEKFGIKSFAISEDLRNLCQGSSTLEEIRGQQEVMVQGPHYKAINKYLLDKGIPSSYITYEDKSKKKKKKT